jgi:hypothetical protein
MNLISFKVFFDTLYLDYVLINDFVAYPLSIFN